MSQRKITYDKTKINMIFEGSKTDWKTRTNMELFILHHTKHECLEIICYNSHLSIESKRSYIDTSLLFPMFNETDVEEALRAKKEVFIRQKKSMDVESLKIEVLTKMSVQYILSRLAVMEGKSFNVELKVLTTDKKKVVMVNDENGDETKELELLETLYPTRPSNLGDVNIDYGKKTTTEDFNESLRKLRHETNALVVETDYADMAINSIDGFKKALQSKVARELELKRSYSKPRLLWVNAINQVLIRNYIEKATKRIAEVEKLQAERQALATAAEAQANTLRAKTKVTSKVSRSTIDNSHLELPKIGSPSASNTLSSSSAGDQDILPPINPNSFKAKRRQRSITSSRRSFEKMQTIRGSDAGIPSIEEIMKLSQSAAAPSLRTSYSEKATEKILNSGSSVRLESIRST